MMERTRSPEMMPTGAGSGAVSAPTTLTRPGKQRMATASGAMKPAMSIRRITFDLPVYRFRLLALASISSDVWELHAR